MCITSGISCLKERFKVAESIEVFKFDCRCNTDGKVLGKVPLLLLQLIFPPIPQKKIPRAA